MLATKKWAAGKAPVRVMFLCVALLAGCTPPGPRAVLEGEKLLLQGNYPQAVATLQRATGLLPQNAQAWNHLGLAYHGAGQAAEAEKAYQQALAPGRNLTVAHYNLGCLYFEEGQYAAAADELRAFTVLQPQHMPAWLRLANAQLRLRQYDAADRSFRYILSINPKSPEAWNGMGIAQLHQRNRARDAMQCFNAALQYQGNYQPALFNIALATHYYLNNRPAALQKYREYLALSPRPENAPLVQGLADQLELELNPPKPAVTNLATNLPPQPMAPPAAANAVTNRTTAHAATNAPAPVRTAATNSRPETIAPPKTNVAVAPKPVIPPPAAPEVKTPPAAPAKETPVEITKVTEPPAIRPAQDPLVTPKAPSPAPTVTATNPVAKTTAPAATAPAVKAAAAPAVATVPPPAESAESSTNKPGFFQRINPVNLFKRTPKTELPPVPATNETSTLIVSNAAAAPTARRTGVTPLPAPAPSSRYTYRRPEKPAGGQRTAAEPYFNEGLLAHKRGQMTAAMAGYEKALQLDPAYFEAQHNLALAIQDTGSLAQALAAYETALAIQPASSAARFNFASALRAGEYYTDAANELEKVLADYPSDADAHLALANLYAQRLGRPQAARPHYQKVLQLAPRHPKATDIRYWLAANPQ